MAEKRTFRTTRKIATALAVALVAFGATVVPASSPVGATCELKPVLRDTMVNQGVQSYPTLSRGKETLVKFFLNKPSCATSNDDIQLVGGTLKVSAPLAGHEALIAHPTPALGDSYPSISAFGTTVHDSAADPIFVVPSAAMAPPLWTGPFDVSFIAQIQYRVKPAGSSVYGDVQTFGPLTVSAKVAGKQNKLRLLIVPMGDTSQTPWEDKQFPSSAQAVVQRTMVTLSRLLPVADGAALFSDTSDRSAMAGIRYGFDPTLIDLGPNGLKLMSSTKKFCGNSANWPQVQTKLSAALQAWNSKNTATPADRVLGVVWEGVSEGAGTKNDCGEGWAAVPGKEAWFRAITSVTPSPSGAVASMELLHTVGRVTEPDPRFVGGYHSKNLEADVTAPNRAYNISLRDFLEDDRSVMRFSPPGWHEESAVLESEDWTYTQCIFTPGVLPVSGCTVPGTFGSAGATTEREVFVLTGTVTNTSVDLHTYFAKSSHFDGPADSSHYRLIQRDGAGKVLQNDGVAVEFSVSHHDHDNKVDHEHTGAVDAAVPVSTSGSGPARFEFWKGDPTVTTTATLLYSRNKDAVPTIGSATATPKVTSERNLTQSPGADEAQPAASPDGSRVAYVRQGNVVVRSADGLDEPNVIAEGSQPAWSPNGARLAFVRNGSVYTIKPDGTDERVVYDRAIQTDLLFPDASHPSFSGDSERLVVAIQGDLWAVKPPADNLQIRCVPAVQIGSCQQLTRTSANIESHPSWRATSNEIVYVRDGELATLEYSPAQGGTQHTLRSVRGSEPEWGRDLVFFSRDGEVRAVDAEVFNGDTRLTSGSWPAPSADGTSLAFTRGSDGDRDVWLATNGGWSLRVVAADSDSGSVLRADFFLRCGSSYPIAVDEEGELQSDGTTVFTVDYDASLGCEGDGLLSVRVTDGWNTVTHDIGTVRHNHAPVGAIYGPGTVLQYDAVPLQANAHDDDGLAEVSFVLTGPDIDSRVVGTGLDPADAQPPLPGGWTPGSYTLTLVLKDSEGETSSTSVTFPILGDKDHDNQPDEKESRSVNPCYPVGAENDGRNASDNYDGDFLVNVDDPEPCKSAYANTSVNFDPDLLYVPSSGSDVTLYVGTSLGSLSAVDPHTVRIVNIAGRDVSLSSTRWFFDSKGGWTAKFNRADLTALIPQQLVGKYVEIVISGRSDTFTFYGRDPASPITAPA